MSFLCLAGFLISSFEFTHYFIYRKKIERCKERIAAAHENYSIPKDVREDIKKQLCSLKKSKSFYRDLFECDHYTEIKEGNLVRLYNTTMGSSMKSTHDLIQLLEDKLEHKFEDGYNEELFYSYCRDDEEIRGIYFPSVFRLPLIFGKFLADMHVNRDFDRVDSEHLVFWVRHRGATAVVDSVLRPGRVLVLMCGIGIGTIPYYGFVKNYYDYYDAIIVVEIKMMSMHLHAEPAEDRALMQELADFVVEVRHELDVGVTDPSLSSCADLMCHSGGTLYFRRLLDFISFRNKILLEPMCFMNGCTKCTRLVFTYDNWNFLFYDPLIKNIPKLLDIGECILLTTTDLSNCTIFVSDNDWLMPAENIKNFVDTYFPDVLVHTLVNATHGDAVMKYHKQVADVLFSTSLK